MASECVFLNKINQSKQDWKIHVRIERMWDVLDLKRNTITGIDLILLDTNGQQMHASIPSNHTTLFRKDLKEKQVIILENFVVDKKDNSYCPYNYPLKIKFKHDTTVTPGDNSVHFPSQSFTFTEFHKLEQKLDKVDQLLDVIGIFKKIDDNIDLLKTKKGDCSKQDLYIKNECGQKIRIAFWGKSIEQLSSIQPTSGEDKIVVIVTSTTAKKFDGTLYLQATFASKIYTDMDLPETITLKQSITNPMLKRKFQQDTTKLISEILLLTHESHKPFKSLCLATITKVHHSEGFCYNACKKCNKGLAIKGAKYWCYRCSKPVEDPILRLSIHFQIEDPTGTKDITAFEKEAEFLLGLQFDALLTLSLQENGDVLLKEKLETMVGKKFKFEIRITEYNLLRPETPFTAGKILPADKKAKQT